MASFGNKKALHIQGDAKFVFTCSECKLNLFLECLFPKFDGVEGVSS